MGVFLRCLSAIRLNLRCHFCKKILQSKKTYVCIQCELFDKVVFFCSFTLRNCPFCVRKKPLRPPCDIFEVKEGEDLLNNLPGCPLPTLEKFFKNIINSSLEMCFGIINFCTETWFVGILADRRFKSLISVRTIE